MAYNHLSLNDFLQESCRVVPMSTQYLRVCKSNERIEYKLQIYIWLLIVINSVIVTNVYFKKIAHQNNSVSVQYSIHI